MPILKDLSALQQALKRTGWFERRREACRWIPEENLHLTLHFLGYAEREKEALLLERLKEIQNYPAHDQKLDRLLYFPNRRSARVASIGGKAAPSTRGLWKMLGQWVGELGVRVEGRDFQAHLTLVRFRAPVTVELEAERLLSELVTPLVLPIRSVLLYESELDPQGSRYRVVQEFPLAPPGGK